jgi:hypothetical protein
MIISWKPLIFQFTWKLPLPKLIEPAPMMITETQQNAIDTITGFAEKTRMSKLLLSNASL